MAKRNSMSTARRSRHPSSRSADQTRRMATNRLGSMAEGESSAKSRPGALLEILSVERRRLMKADAVLGCVAFALLYEDWLEDPSRPCFADAVAVAQELVSESIGRLSS
jgi:hypothetical protein